MADLDSIHQTISSLLVRVSNLEGRAEVDLAKIDSMHQRLTAVEAGIGTRLDQLARKLDDEATCRRADQRELLELRERHDGAIATLAKDAGHRDRLDENVRQVLTAQEDDARAEHARPLAAERIAAASGDELEVIAERLGLLRKGSMIDEQPLETDDSLRLRCATAFFAQSFDRGLAMAIILECQRARYPDAKNPAGWSPAEWIVDAVMAAAGAQRPSAYVDVVFDGPPGLVAGRFVELENERGESISLGHWVPPKKNAEHYPLQPNRDNDLWRLRIPLAAVATSSLREYAEQTGQVAHVHVHLYRDGHCACGDLSPTELARRARLDEQADKHQAELTAALGYAPRSVGWPRMLELVRETIAQRNDARRRAAALTADRDALLTWKARIASALNVTDDMHLIEAAANHTYTAHRALIRQYEDRNSELYHMTVGRDAASEQLDITKAHLDKFMSACADQTIQIMELRGELSRLKDARPMGIPAAEAIAKACAVRHRLMPNAPSYLHGALDSDWRPHAWVVDAVRGGSLHRSDARARIKELEAEVAQLRADQVSDGPPTSAHEIPISEPDPLSGL